MTWQLWLLVGLFVVSAAYAPFRVDKPREPVTVDEAIAAIFLNIIFIMLVFWGTP